MSRADVARARAEIEQVVAHGAVDESVAAQLIEGQLLSAAELKVRIEQQGGALLGDEVGAGKTFVAMALIVDALARNPQKGAVVLVPKPALVDKWIADLRLYVQAAVGAKNPQLASRLLPRIVRLDRGLTSHKRTAIAVGQQNLFMGQLSKWDCAQVLRTFLRTRTNAKGLHLKPWFAQFGLGRRYVEQLPDWTSPWADPELLGDDPDVLDPLDPLLDAYRDRRSIEPWEARDALQTVRRNVARRHLPAAALLVIDEAHHLRSTNTTRYWTMSEVLTGRFDGMLFLTATPFQMGPSELRNVIEFAQSSGRRGSGSQRSQEFEIRVTEMVEAMEAHIAALQSFGRAWADLDEPEAIQAQTVVAGTTSAEEVGQHVALAAQYFEHATATKQDVERALQPFLLRTVREHFRSENPGLPPDSGIDEASRIPIALVDRMLFETFDAGSRTFIASALLSACSSWEALFDSANLTTDDVAGSRTRTSLLELQRRDSLGRHPKVEATLRAIRETIDKGEKALVFVERVPTGRMLRRRLDEELQTAGESAADNERARRQLQDRTRLGWPALRENYLHTLLPKVFGITPDLGRLDALRDRHLSRFQVADRTTLGARRDYSVEKRFWEQINFLEAVESRPSWSESATDIEVETVERILHDDYILNGLDLKSSSAGTPRRGEPGEHSDRAPQMEFAAAYATYKSPWAPHAAVLCKVPPDLRAEFVEAVARAIALSHIRQELLELDFAGSAPSVFAAVAELMDRDSWSYRFSSLIEQLGKAIGGTEYSDQADAAETRIQSLIAGLKSQNRVQYIDGGTKSETRLAAVNGFNTPMYPDVLIATDVLGEGIDLHRNCRTVIHHDLPWNPARLEQRTGRIDRIGSFCDHLREKNPEETIQVHTPYVAGTYDAFIYSQVMSRARVFRWLLGHRPDWEEDALSQDEPPQPVPEDWIEQLQIRLSPHD